ncbi:DUF485 domain-containing protein [Streptomyces fulvoviolaceus]|uniref:DUF485 domain-containing protein n=1 Tax=Streptomyces fulvoviolaceus TaxID=285535 RepID=UPI0021BFF1DE|nr:DUF485 domain-containing protein [Streptomyces fulvoviolaceus]MCT9075660.1 DUF485 domain-containing protein [Streptomyces fulvoviolaceus]
MSRHSTRFGSPPPYSPTPPEQAERQQVSRDPAYQSLRRMRRRFGVRATAVAVGGFLLYVLLSSFVPGLMNQPLIGHLTVGLALGLGQFVLMAVIVWRYLVHIRTHVTPLVRGLRGLARQHEAAGRGRAVPGPAMAPRDGEYRSW